MLFKSFLSFLHYFLSAHDIDAGGQVVGRALYLHAPQIVDALLFQRHIDANGVDASRNPCAVRIDVGGTAGSVELVACGLSLFLAQIFDHDARCALHDYLAFRNTDTGEFADYFDALYFLVVVRLEHHVVGLVEFLREIARLGVCHRGVGLARIVCHGTLEFGAADEHA